jgi:hypothetical protein
MKNRNPFVIDGGVRRMLFFGVAALPMSVLGCLGERLEHRFGEKISVYIFFGSLMVLTALGILLYNVTPRRVILPLGIAGWLISFLFLFWWAWFGSGALR